jgi:hypothetical protein
MGPAGFVEHPGDQVFAVPQGCPADRADTPPASMGAVPAARNVHQPGLAHDGGEYGRLYPFAGLECGGAYRAGPLYLGLIAGKPLKAAVPAPGACPAAFGGAFPARAILGVVLPVIGVFNITLSPSQFEEQRGPKPQQNKCENYKNTY